MLIGHYAPAFLLSLFASSIPFWVLIGSVQLVDIFWGVFVMFGLERVRIVPNFTASNTFDLQYTAFSHSVVATVAWGILGFIFWMLLQRKVICYNFISWNWCISDDTTERSEGGGGIFSRNYVSFHWRLYYTYSRPPCDPCGRFDQAWTWPVELSAHFLSDWDRTMFDVWNSMVAERSNNAAAHLCDCSYRWWCCGFLYSHSAFGTASCSWRRGFLVSGNCVFLLGNSRRKRESLEEKTTKDVKFHVRILALQMNERKTQMGGS